jgi:hypothetical protein
MFAQVLAQTSALSDALAATRQLILMAGCMALVKEISGLVHPMLVGIALRGQINGSPVLS